MDKQDCLLKLGARFPMPHASIDMERVFRQHQACMHAAMHGFSAADRAIPVIGVAGTNGKGSCASLLAQIYQRAGYRVGLFTSPHLQWINERMVVNGQMISDADFVRIVGWILENPACDVLAFFSILVLAAWQYFIEQSVDVMVFEVGLGGRLDAVNALPLTAGVITSIGLDHIDVLGDNLAAIACEKAGIVRAHCPMIIAEPVFPDEALAWLQSKGACLYQWDQDFSVAMDGDALCFIHDQQRLVLPQTSLHPQSLGAALMLVQALISQLPVSAAVCQQAVTDWHMPGRMSCIDVHRQIWVDVAHNLPAVAHVLAHWPHAWADTMLVLHLQYAKDWRGIVSTISQMVSTLYLLDVQLNHDLQASVMDSMIPRHGLSTTSRFVPIDEIRAAFPAVKILPFVLPPQLLSDDLQSKLDSPHCKKLILGSFHAAAMAQCFLSASSD